MNVCDDIKKRYIRLSRSQRKVAQFVMDNPYVVTTHTAFELGKMIGVSESTVIRFCYAMGLSGYSDFQRNVKEYINESDNNNEKEIPLIKKHERIASEIMNRDIKSILNSIPLIDEENFQQAVEWMHESSSIYVLGFRQSSPTASFLTSTLKTLRPHVIQIQHDVENIVHQISNMDDHSLLIVISLEPVQEDILTILELAKNKNVKIVAIATATLSPIRDVADIMFTLSVQKQEYADSITATCSFIHALIEGMITQNKNKYITFQKSNAQIESKFPILESVKI